MSAINLTPIVADVIEVGSCSPCDLAKDRCYGVFKRADGAKFSLRLTRQQSEELARHACSNRVTVYISIECPERGAK